MAEDPSICSICMSNRINGLMSSCGHSMCDTCALQWLGDHMECPFCRQSDPMFRRFVSYE
jgi:predicted amidophosphoribosyltransferase